MKVSPSKLIQGESSNNLSLVLVQPRKTRPYITERFLMVHKESNQTKTKNVQTGSKEEQPCLLHLTHHLDF